MRRLRRIAQIIGKLRRIESGEMAHVGIICMDRPHIQRIKLRTSAACMKAFNVYRDMPAEFGVSLFD